jgi:zinc finger protein
MADELNNQPCPMCKEKSLSLNERDMEVPYFGKILLFSMTCSNCKYHMSDVETEDKHETSKYTLEVSTEEDLKARVVKSGQATVKIPHISTITPGPASIGYVSNIEGVINRIKRIIEVQRDSEDDPAKRKKAKNLLKKINKVLWGQEKIKVIIEDPTGNSAIISEKAVKG